MNMVKAVGIVAAYALTAIATDELTGMQEAICLVATTWYLGREVLVMVDEDGKGDEDEEMVA